LLRNYLAKLACIWNAGRRYTLYPHLAGTEGEDRLAAKIYNTWTQQGLDYVTNDTYEVLLSYPNRSDPNYVSLLDGNGRQVYRSQLFEKILSHDQNHSDVIPPFNAFSPSGHVKVYESFVVQPLKSSVQYVVMGHSSDLIV